MSMVNRSRLPLLALRAFEAVARNLSVSKAAVELHVTAGAVSQQVKLLEETIGVPLLRRSGRSVEMTDAGQILRPALTQAFQTMEITLGAIARRRSHDTIKLCLLPTVAEKWLMPRLARFQGEHPGIDIQILTSFRPIQFHAEDVDMASFVGKSLPSGLEGVRLFEDEILPVCSPALLRGREPLTAPRDFADFTLLYSVRRMDDWNRWLTMMGAPDVQLLRSLSFENSSLAIQAAIDGLGIAMIQRAYVKDQLRAGTLVAPFEQVARSASGYYLIWSEGGSSSAAFLAFQQWILKEVALTAAG
jgi:LysR family glycine cleavage system transcriptional activator